MTRLPPRAHAVFPDLSACPEECAELIARWEAVLSRAPRLRPWLEEMVRQERARRQESARGSIERALWFDLARWLAQFEALPQFAAAAIAVTLEERPAAPRPAVEPEPPAPADSPERATSDAQALLGDPAFALAFHCIDVRVRPFLDAVLPEWAWFGLLHASSPQEPLLTAAVAVAVVLRALSAGWARLPSPARRSAVRLFHATEGDLRAQGRIEALCRNLPAGWKLDAASAGRFVPAAARARDALGEASRLCARLAAAARPTQRGGLSVLQVDRASRATAAELAEVAESARRYPQLPGLARLLALLPDFFASGDAR